MSLVLTSPFEFFTDTAGTPLESGYIYIGVANLNPESNPITVYWDANMTIPAQQPIRTSGGYPVLNGSARNVYIPGSYSVSVKDKNQRLVFSSFNPVSGFAGTFLTLLKTVDGSGSGLISEGLQSIEITDLNFDPTALGLAIREVRAYSTSFGPANQPNNSVVDYFNITLTKVDATSFILSMHGRDLSNKPTGGFFTRYWTAGAWGSWKWFVDQYDFVVDSNEALNQLFAHTGGLYKRVLIKAGTWSTSVLGPTAGVFWDLGQTGTNYVFAEMGSNIVLTASYGAGTLYGVYRSSAFADVLSESFEGLKITISNSGANSSVAFYNCGNMSGCSGSASSVLANTATGFKNCLNISRCNGIGATASGVSYGFESCSYISDSIGSAGAGSGGTCSGFGLCFNISNCKALATGDGTGGVTANGFNSCRRISCSQGEAVSGVSGVASGFKSCYQLDSCLGIGTGGTFASNGLGFQSCVGVVNCSGIGVASGSGAGYAFLGCTKMQQNSPSGASKTATYNTSYADSAAANACADTAAGGYNS